MSYNEQVHDDDMILQYDKTHGHHAKQIKNHMSLAEFNAKIHCYEDLKLQQETLQKLYDNKVDGVENALNEITDELENICHHCKGTTMPDAHWDSVLYIQHKYDNGLCRECMDGSVEKQKYQTADIKQYKTTIDTKQTKIQEIVLPGAEEVINVKE